MQAKSLQRPNLRNLPDISKGLFPLGICESDPWKVSQPFPRSVRLPKRRENGAEIPAFAHSRATLDLRLVKFEGEIAERLRPCPRIFPFCGEYRRRLVRSRLLPRTAVKLRGEKKCRPQGGLGSANWRVLLNRAINAAVGRRPIWWNGLIVTLATGAIALLQKYGWHLATPLL